MEFSSISDATSVPPLWAATHRVHHRHADLPDDPHSPRTRSFRYAFASWLWDRRNSDTDFDTIRHLPAVTAVLAGVALVNSTGHLPALPGDFGDSTRPTSR